MKKKIPLWQEYQNEKENSFLVGISKCTKVVARHMFLQQRARSCRKIAAGKSLNPLTKYSKYPFLTVQDFQNQIRQFPNVQMLAFPPQQIYTRGGAVLYQRAFRKTGVKSVAWGLLTSEREDRELWGRSLQLPPPIPTYQDYLDISIYPEVVLIPSYSQNRLVRPSVKKFAASYIVMYDAIMIMIIFTNTI